MNGPRATICSCEGFSNALPSLFFPSVCLGDVALQDLTLNLGTEVEFANTCEGFLNPLRTSELELTIGVQRGVTVEPIKLGGELTVPIPGRLPLSVKGGGFIKFSEAADFLGKAF